ncbi:MAG TPA: EamA family transporter RarD [Tepidisphaeraceae bacterium]|nr:EamA family transporter RarD [Tepidisphaeraceae bacterium]
MPPAAPPNPARLGLIYGVAAYFTWGIVPAYFKLLSAVPPIQLLAHRVVWSVAFLVGLIHFRKLWPDVRAAFANRRTLLSLAASTLFIAVNWFAFIYAVAIGQILQTSLGYFITPLVTVLLGMIFLKERLRPLQIVSLLIAAGAVLYYALDQSQFPTIALTLAASFSLYGLVRKTTAAGPLVGLFVETALLFPLGVGAIVTHFIHPWSTSPAFPDVTRDQAIDAILRHTPLLLAAGVITALPLLWFANAARRLRLSTLGLLQYTAPTVSFLLAVFIFKEPYTRAQQIAFPLIWLALVLFSIDSIRAYRAQQAPSKQVPHPEEACLTDM